jgi:hypothetical protein
MTSSYSADNISAHVQLRIGVAFKSCCLLSVLAVTICSDVAQYSHREAVAFCGIPAINRSTCFVVDR